MSSIRRRLLRWLLIGQLLAVVLAGAITYFYLQSELEDLFDDRLRQLAYSVPAAGSLVPAPAQLRGLEDEDDDYVIQVWRQDGAPLLLINRREGTPGRAPEGFSNHWSNGVLWRSFVLRRGVRLVQASQPFDDRLEMSTRIALGAIAPVLVLVVVLGGLVWIGVGRGLRPLNELAEAIGRRRPSAPDPLPDAGLPAEIRPLVEALNALLERLGRTLEGQRRFVADAAHELRTPLAAVQLQAQLLQRAGSDQERSEALEQIRAGTRRASHLVRQLLTLARLDPDDRQSPFCRVDLSALVKSVVVEHAAAATGRQIDLGLSQDAPLTINGDAEGLRVMLGNLIDNAIRYTPPGGRVDVALKAATGLAVLEVVDNGPGIATAEQRRVFERFYRRPGSSEPGSGLGLAIVREVVTRHHGEVELKAGARGEGLAVTVRLPGAEPAAGEVRAGRC